MHERETSVVNQCLSMRVYNWVRNIIFHYHLFRKYRFCVAWMNMLHRAESVLISIVQIHSFVVGFGFVFCFFSFMVTVPLFHKAEQCRWAFGKYDFPVMQFLFNESNKLEMSYFRLQCGDLDKTSSLQLNTEYSLQYYMTSEKVNSLWSSLISWYLIWFG